jgi:hypothetical protein
VQENGVPKKTNICMKLLTGKISKQRKFQILIMTPVTEHPKKPRYCPNISQYVCLEKNCPHLAYTDGLEEDYSFLNKKYRKKKH